MHFVYVLACADGSYYVGETTDPEKREKHHNEGRGGTYTARRLPVRLLYSETFPTREEALERERQIKRWTAAKKAALISKDAQALRGLSQRRRR